MFAQGQEMCYKVMASNCVQMGKPANPTYLPLRHIKEMSQITCKLTEMGKGGVFQKNLDTPNSGWVSVSQLRTLDFRYYRQCLGLERGDGGKVLDSLTYVTHSMVPLSITGCNYGDP